MNKVFFLLLSSLSFYFVSAQGSWAWVQGDAFTPGYGLYGTKGVADTMNKPAARTGQAIWKDASGDVWMFGGYGNSSTGTGYLNDMWKYSPATDAWTWISGEPVENQRGVFGAKGAASPQNNVRARSFSTSWTDAAGNFWLYGGRGYEPTIPQNAYVFFDDLWKYNPLNNQWTWMGGDTAYNVNAVYSPVYGTKGVARATNKPASRIEAAGWTDTSGDLWLYGGIKNGFGSMNDLWKYAVSSGLWTWIGGDTVINQSGKFRVRNVPDPLNYPGSKRQASTWTDSAGNFWLFGGNSGFFNANLHMNDLWKYSPSTNIWTWMGGDTTINQSGVYGTKGNSSGIYKPGARNGAVEWIDDSGNLLLYGGTNSSGAFKDLWKFSLSSNEWTWLSGDSSASIQQRAIYGDKKMASDTTRPGSGIFAGSWTDNTGNLWLSNTDILWKYSLASSQWTWIRGDTIPAGTLPIYPGVYGMKGVAGNTTIPRARRYGTTWTDASNNFWMYGGDAYSPTSFGSTNYLNDLWKYDPSTSQWTWISGDSVYAKQPVYGTQNTPDPLNTPGARTNAAGWTDASGNLWLFGGYSPNVNGGMAYFSDLWKFTPSTGLWTWIDGSRNTTGVYRTRGVSTATTRPGGRFGAVTWMDASGDVWLFGGDGYAGNFLYSNKGKLNDLWRYTSSNNRWAWISGDTTTSFFNVPASQPGEYGTKGVAAAGNKPGGRSGSAGWIDASGNLWLFGGTTDVGGNNENDRIRYLNDLWKYAPLSDQWTWMSGDNILNQKGLYGTQGAPAANATPGARKFAKSWKDKAGNFYLFGGDLDSTFIWTGFTPQFYNDCWKYSVTTNQWTWLSGDSSYNRAGMYGTQGIASATNYPGARDGSMGWNDNAGNFWLFSGYGSAANGFRFLNDMLKFTTSSALPVLFSSFTAQKQQQSVLLNWSTAQEQNSMSFTIERSADGIFYSSIGTVAAAGHASSTSKYSFTDITPLQGNNFYRLKEVDLDSKFMYSSIQKVFIGEEATRFAIVNNPAQHDVQISVQLPAAQKLQLQVRNAGGHLLLQKEYMAAKGTNQLWLPVNRFAKGTYYITVQSAGLYSTKPFVKQ